MTDNQNADALTKAAQGIIMAIGGLAAEINDLKVQLKKVLEEKK